jgi:hypothetical protein
MTKYFSKWKGSPIAYSIPAQEWAKIVPKLYDAVKAGMDSGVVKDWQEFAGSSEGYMVWEGSEMQVVADIAKYRPYIEFEPIIALMSLAQVVESTKKRAAAASR